MPNGICRLCGENAALQLSHVLPAFAFKWLRETSGTGHIRSSQEVNQRVQDGMKFYWMCAGCEGILSRSETAFATKVFHPYSSGKATRFNYGPWLMHFCVSVSWRLLRFYREETPMPQFPAELLSAMDRAEATWKEVLLGKRPHPGEFEQHLIPFDEVASATHELPSNFNRYVMRAIDADLTRGGSTNVVYGKMGRFLVLGFYKVDHPRQWKGTKVHANQGVLEPRKYVLPKQFGEFLNHKANRASTAFAGMSDRQQSKVQQAFHANIDRFADSDAFKAMDNDVCMFGGAAFKEPPESIV